MADPTMDIFSALNALFTGLRQNMRQSQQDELQGLSTLARLPGMQVTQATNAQPAPWWQHLLGMPAYRAGADGAPVAAIGRTPMTVTKEPSAFESLEKLFGTASDQAEPSAMAMEQSPILETDRLASPGATATLPAPTMTARQRHAATLAQQYGLDPAELQNDVLFQAEFTKPGSTVADMRKYVTELAKTKRETRNAATEQYPKYLDIIAREYLQAKDTPSLQAANVRLARLGVPQDLLRDLPRVYEPNSVQAWVQRGLSPAVATEADREGAKIRVATPALAERERAMGLPRLENKLDEREVLGPVERAQRLQQLQDEAPYKIEQARAQGALAGDRAYEAAVSKPLENEAKRRVNNMIQSEAIVNALATEFTPAERQQYVGLLGAKLKTQQIEQALKELTGQRTDPKLGRFAALLSAAQSEAFSTVGQTLTGSEKGVTWGYISTGQEWSAADFEQKLALSRQRLPGLIDREIELSTTPARDLAAKRRSGALSGTLPDLPAPGPMTDQEIDLNLLETNKLRRAQGKPEVTRSQIIDGLRKLGHEVP